LVIDHDEVEGAIGMKCQCRYVGVFFSVFTLCGEGSLNDLAIMLVTNAFCRSS
jgi:hypothetical protein